MRYLYHKNRVREYYLQKHISQVQLPLASFNSLNGKGKPNSPKKLSVVPERRRRLLDLDGSDDNDSHQESDSLGGQSTSLQQQSSTLYLAASQSSVKISAVSLN